MGTHSVKVRSYAFVHTGGTMYYRIAAVTLSRGTKTVHALYSNYGPYKGDLAIQKPMHGGTSGVYYATSEAELERRLLAEIRRRTGRSYRENTDHAFATDSTRLSDAEITTILRGHVGLTTGHFDELIQESEPGGASEEAIAVTRADFAALIAKTKSDFSAKHPLTASMKGIEKSDTAPAKMMKPKAPPIPAPVIERCASWGSW